MNAQVRWWTWGKAWVLMLFGLFLCATAPATEPAAVLIDGQGVSREELWPLLAEATGGAVVEDVVLDRRLGQELKRLSLVVTEADIAEERRLLVKTLMGEAQLGEDGVERVVTDLRRQRGLGDQRFAQLLRRLAMLRAMVRDKVTVSEAAVRRQCDVEYGPRRRVLLLTCEREEAAADARREVTTRAAALAGGLTGGLGVGRGSEPTRAALMLAFAEVARERSTDLSASAGGAIEPLSPEDTSYPSAVREAVGRLKPGELSEVIPLSVREGNGGAAVLLMVDELPGRASEPGKTFASQQASIEQKLRIRAERAAMDDIVRTQLARDGVSVLDRALGWSVDAMKQGRARER